MNETEEPTRSRLTGAQLLRHLVFFQLKLALDALRDFALSPLSILAFAVDAIRQPEPANSLYFRLMKLGRRSDRIINLFDEYSADSSYTVDRTFSEVESSLQAEWRRREQHRHASRMPDSAKPVDPYQGKHK